MAEHGTLDANRYREPDRALEILERTCECANAKMPTSDGSLGESCRQCQHIEEQGQQHRLGT